MVQRRQSPRQEFVNVSELQLLGAGIRCLHARLRPKAAEGKEVSSGKGVCLEQLVADYVQSQDEQHQRPPHVHALSQLDARIFEELARYCFGPRSEPDSLRAFGRSLLLVVGICEVLPARVPAGALGWLPPCWAVWPAGPQPSTSKLALFRPKELQAEALEAAPAAVGKVAVLRSPGSAGEDPSHVLHWEVATLDRWRIQKDLATDGAQAHEALTKVGEPYFEVRCPEDLQDGVSPQGTGFGSINGSLASSTHSWMDVSLDGDGEEEPLRSDGQHFYIGSPRVRDIGLGGGVLPSAAPSASSRSGSKSTSGMLGRYGFQAKDDDSWLDVDRMPRVRVRVVTHEESRGHTQYQLACALLREGREPFQWSVTRRLVHLRDRAHDLVKGEMGTAYEQHFQGAPFAHRFAPKGTTARLDGWFRALSICAATGALRPRALALLLQFLDIPPPT